MTDVTAVRVRVVPVGLAPRPTVPGEQLSVVLESAPATIDAAIDLALELARRPASIGDRWEALATIAAVDLGFVRAVEPHLDARGILDEWSAASATDAPVDDRSWGVFAAEGGDDPLTAYAVDGGWRLSGTKPWCSLAGRLDAALVTARLDAPAGEPVERRLFSVSLRDAGVEVIDGAWKSRGLVEIPSGPVRFTGVPAETVGDPGWYLTRPGFAIGGIGVAACWYGGAVGIARTVFATLASRSPNAHAIAHLGAIDELLQGARRALAEAAELVSRGDANGDAGKLLAHRVRATVARACDEIIERSGRALGPAPLALDAAHAKRVADLSLYVRQYHSERDQEALGRSLLDSPSGDVSWIGSTTTPGRAEA